MMKQEIDNGGTSSASSAKQTNETEVTLITSEGDSASSDEDGIEVEIKKNRYSYWVFVRKFENAALAREAVPEDTWAINYTIDTNEGKQEYYRCQRKNQRKSQCPAGIYLLYESTSDAVLLFQNEGEHDHSIRIPETVKLHINDMVDRHMKPMAIMTALTKIKEIEGNVPHINQLSYYVRGRHSLLYPDYPNDTIGLRDWEHWLQNNSDIPENPHETFVIAYEIPSDEVALRFVLSNKYLLKLACDATILHADSIYSFSWQGYYIYIVGTTDKQQKFHPLCLTVSTTEQKAVFQMTFKSLKDKIQSLFLCSFKPTILVADAANSIQSAFTEVFEDTTVRMCWTHAKRRIKSQLDYNIKGIFKKSMIIRDLETLHLITSRDAFLTAKLLFLEKYLEEQSFITFFKEEWLLKNSNWYLGAASPSPSTNSAFESFVKATIDSDMFPKRLPLFRFLKMVKEMVNEWSTRYTENPEENFFAKTPVISVKEWRNSFSWAKGPCEFNTISRDEHVTRYEVPNDTECKNFEQPPTNFNEFVEQFFSKWKVTLPLNKEEWAQGQCTCPIFWEKYICEHVIGLSIRFKHTYPPPAIIISDIKIVTQKKKRGRPRKFAAVQAALDRTEIRY